MLCGHFMNGVRWVFWYLVQADYHVTYAGSRFFVARDGNDEPLAYLSMVAETYNGAFMMRTMNLGHDVLGLVNEWYLVCGCL